MLQRLLFILNLDRKMNYNWPFQTMIFFMLSVNIHARERQPKLFLPSMNLTVVENDIAILWLMNPESLECRERIIWPVCLPEQVRS